MCHGPTLLVKSLGSVRFFSVSFSYAYQGCIYLINTKIRNTVKYYYNLKYFFLF